MRLHRILTMSVMLLAGLAWTSHAEAQLPFRWFGPKSADKNPPTKAAQSDARRQTETSVEIAWLADPVTFPYYLEAHVTGSQLEVRGYVPAKSVREQAIRIAQLYSSLTVVDSMKEHPSLLVRPSTMSPQQLEASVQSALKMALPKQYQQLKIECGNDGRVFVAGPVNTCEEKVAVSHSLRRLHGCTSVQNLTSMPSEIAQQLPKDRVPIIQTSRPPEPAKQKPVVAQEKPTDTRTKWSFWPWSKNTTKDEPPVTKPAPTDKKLPPVIEVKTDGPAILPIEVPKAPELRGPRDDAKTEAPTPISAKELQKRIRAASPKALNVEIEFTSKTEVRIQVEVRSEGDVSATAERILAMPELRGYQPDLLFKIGSP